MEANKQAPKSQLNSLTRLCFDANKRDPARLVPGFFSHAAECPDTSNDASTWRRTKGGEEKRESIAEKGVLIRTVRNLIARSRDRLAKGIAPFGRPTTTRKTPKKEMVHLGPPKNSLSGIKVSHGKESHASFQPLGNFGNLDNPGPPSNIEIVIEYCNRSPAPAHVYRHTFIDEATDYRDSQAYIVKNSENCAQENPTGYRRTDHPTKKVFHQENNPATKSRKSY
ncbi:hypothetical protein C8F04DRAFT_1179783 [Mycena alexandri]|uniref:Uncharacterized protein n=1 Tax=Mycena alexandri TaxID=1745969 RepID=A0AAD6X3L8_9AGAR|nr:hypothetical protein C8F04DRAFT_1183850 [Mycena alexandri]KAJ7038482.1 hypothetical protein C8F04DRAFT_1179783 [Mycena alexandri]